MRFDQISNIKVRLWAGLFLVLFLGCFSLMRLVLSQFFFLIYPILLTTLHKLLSARQKFCTVKVFITSATDTRHCFFRGNGQLRASSQVLLSLRFKMSKTRGSFGLRSPSYQFLIFSHLTRCDQILRPSKLSEWHITTMEAVKCNCSA